MPKLQKIDLSNNAITKVYERAFAFPKHDASGLVVDLSNNAITSIEAGMLEGVRVCSFDLRNNYLISLPEAVYRPIIDFTAASAVFWTKNNPFDCDSRFCWIATNQTVSETFNTVLCDNLGNRTVEAITPDCLIPSNITTPRYSRSLGHPLRPVSFRKSQVSTAVRNLRRPSLWRP
ncbi:hypothetical protein E2C01_073065 [Portunus trituberculatus]|uniref:Uncharacterized protein n=1 Tax=Portunus trituberculatus TaxID=210409 RepID=A0A5B7I8W6_PORTR|nr:hypothetical protein [Portunus trituberculatus]